jgi:hypothetical protein
MVRRLAALFVLAVIATGCAGGHAIAVSTAIALPTPTPAATPTPLPTPEATIAPAPTPEVSAAPAGYQQIVSATSGYAISIPSSWTYVTADGDTSVADQVAAVKLKYPVLSAIVDTETALLGQSVKLVLFDPAGAKVGRAMTGNLIISAPSPGVDLKSLAATYAAEIKSLYKVKTVTTSETTLPAGPTVVVTYPLTSSGVVMKIVQYIILAPEHSFALTLASNSGVWTHYQPIFLAVAKSLQSLL